MIMYLIYIMGKNIPDVKVHGTKASWIIFTFCNVRLWNKPFGSGGYVYIIQGKT